MAGRLVRFALVAILAVGAGSGVAWADVDNDDATNAQEGDNSGDTNQDGESASGDAVAGQVVGGVSAGDTSIDATNLSDGSSAESGDVSGSNSASTFAGLDAGSETVVAADVDSDSATNVQEGDNDVSVDQNAEAIGGDGVGGQVIGAVTSAGGSLDIVAANTGGDGEGGGASADNTAAGFAGLNGGGNLLLGAADVDSASATNVQEGDNEFEAGQTANANGGDGVGGQVIGAVSAGDTSIDATNDGGSGDGGSASASNEAFGIAGLNVSDALAAGGADVTSATATNVQEGDNTFSAGQDADAAGGDGVGGQVVGAVTSGGGSADIVAANTGGSGDGGSASASNSASGFAMLDTAPVEAEAPPELEPLPADISNASATNVQEGDNDLSADQSASAVGGDGVGGQVIGAVSAGDTSIDATNEGGSGDGGDASASNSASGFVGLEAASETFSFADIENLSADNVHEGDNSASFDQTAEAAGGDGVGGMVTGVVTSAGGSADLVLANTGGDAEAGSASMHNDSTTFTGLNAFGQIFVL